MISLVDRINWPNKAVVIRLGIVLYWKKEKKMTQSWLIKSGWSPSYEVW